MNRDNFLDRTFTVRRGGRMENLDVYSDEGFQALAQLWTRAGWHRKVSYEVTWLGIPVIQLPEDLLILQELIWRTRPDVVIETGIAHGGSLIFYASILELLGRGRVIGIDLEIRKYNRLAIESHSMSERTTMIEGSSTDPEVVARVRSLLQPSERVMVMLDSNHSKAHVLEELTQYSSFVTPGSWLIVFDSVMNLVHDSPRASETWASDNPMAAVEEFLRDHPEFESSPQYERMGVTYCAGGFLRRLER